MLPIEFNLSRAKPVLTTCEVSGLAKTTEWGFVSAEDIANPDDERVWFFIHTNHGYIVSDGEFYYNVLIEHKTYKSAPHWALGRIFDEDIKILNDSDTIARYGQRGHPLSLNDKDIVNKAIEIYVDKAK